MRNAFEVFLEVRELLYVDKKTEAKDMVSKLCLDCRSEEEEIFTTYLAMLAGGKRRSDFISYMRDKDEKYHMLPNLSDSKTMLVIKGEFAKILYTQEESPVDSLYSLDEIAESIYLISQQIDDKAATVYLMNLAAYLRFINKDLMLHAIIALGLMKFVVENRNDIPDRIISGLLLDLFISTLMTLNATYNLNSVFSDVVKEAMREITRELGVKETMSFFAHKIMGPLPYEMKINGMLMMFSDLKSSYAGFYFGENFIRAFMETVNQEIKECDKKRVLSKCSSTFEGQEYLFPHIAYVSYMEENDLLDECIRVLKDKLEEDYPDSVKSYFKTLIGDLSGDSDMISEGCKEALDIYLKTDSPIAKYTLIEFSEYAI